VVEKAWAGIRSLTANGKLCIEGGDYAALGQLMDLNQMILSGLMLSTPEIEELCGAARSHGAHGAKLTGAGGGGAVLALAPSAATAESIVVAWQALGYLGFATVVRGDLDDDRMNRTAGDLQFASKRASVR
jgi:mevalonate kinase